MSAGIEALDHLVHIKALGSKEGNHGVGLGSDGSVLSYGILGALGYIPALVSEVGAKGGLVHKEEGAISELLQVLEALGVFTPELDISWAIPIVWGNPEFAPREFHIPDNPVNIGDGYIDSKSGFKHGFYIPKFQEVIPLKPFLNSPFMFL